MITQEQIDRDASGAYYRYTADAEVDYPEWSDLPDTIRALWVAAVATTETFRIASQTEASVEAAKEG